MSIAPLSRTQLEDLWREQLTEALQRYRLAKLEAANVSVRNRNGELPSPDGQFAYRKAIQAETRALAEYKRILLIFNDLILEGKVPPGILTRST
jgi:hypothetical protein